MEAGTNQKVITDSGIILDFSGIFGTDESNVQNKAATRPVEPPLGKFEYRTTVEHENPLERRTDALETQQAKPLYLQAQQEAEAHRRNVEVYKTYQENIRKSGQLQTEILKGIKAGEGIYNLFLKAVKAISFMTSNELFYSQIEADMRTIYGEGLQEQAPLKSELDAVQNRLIKLKEALKIETKSDSRERISRAIQAHEAKITQLQEKIDQADKSI